MATITRIEAQPVAPIREVRYFPEAASQSFKKGEFCYLDANGKLTVCAADPAGVCGMAMQDASGTANTAIAVCMAKRGQQFAVHATSTTKYADVGKKYGLVVTSNKHYLDQTDTTNLIFLIDDLDPRDAVGDTYGRYIVEIVDAASQLDSGTS